MEKRNLSFLGKKKEPLVKIGDIILIKSLNLQEPQIVVKCFAFLDWTRKP